MLAVGEGRMDRLKKPIPYNFRDKNKCFGEEFLCSLEVPPYKKNNKKTHTYYTNMYSGIKASEHLQPFFSL